MDDLFSDALRRLLQDHCTPHVVREIEAGSSAQPLWLQLEQSGFADAMLGEVEGGGGLGLTELFPLIELCGNFALPVPLAETMLARALLARGGAALPEGSICFAEAPIGTGGGIACSVAYGAVADWALVRCEEATLLLPVAAATRASAVFPLDARLAWSAAAVASAQALDRPYDLHTLQACISAAQLAGGLTTVLDRTLKYANERAQFGRPIGKFQAIQHQLSVIAEHTFAARMASQIGCRGNGIIPDRTCVAIAKARASEAALEVAALAHSIHGAIGFTAEFDLQLFTRRLHAWRQAGGSESYWHDVIGIELIDRNDGRTIDLLRSVTDIH